MNIPDKIIESLETLEPATRGQVYCALIYYMHNEDPQLPFEMTPAATEVWLQTKAVLDPILRRRRRDAERRRRKKAEQTTATRLSNEVQKEKSESPANTGKSDNNNFTFPKMNRRERREYERGLRRLQRKLPQGQLTAFSALTGQPRNQVRG